MGAVLRMTAGVVEFATTTGVTIGAMGVEETATGCVRVHGHSLIVRVVACKRNVLVNAHTGVGLRRAPSLPR